jgi:3-hydroxy-3-methylglutaryl CoA synthase
MTGIISYGAYVPRLRLSRMSIYQQMSWLTPATVMVAQGERSMCNWDEDSLTMAVAAARRCLAGVDPSRVDGLYLASTTLPYADRLNSGIAATALSLRGDIRTADFTSALKAGTSALVAALDSVGGGKGRQVLVAAADAREATAGSFYEMWFGDGRPTALGTGM